ncbi:MAG: hypothetical protein SPL30_08650 [Succinivibrio sp.]|jgi:predicted alpha/beta superfamily hydrolase|nr:hypothetical protein [Succinivibrio sp.]
MKAFTSGRHNIRLYPAKSANSPCVLALLSEDEAPALPSEIAKIPCRDHSLICVSGFDWNEELSPWPCDRVDARLGPFGGHADVFLKELLEKILPQAECALPERSQLMIAGYSLAGLFSLWALTRTPLFAAAASVSGSLWYPDFIEYLKGTPLQCAPQRIYLSLGDRERLSKSTVIATVEERTSECEAWLQSQGIDSCFELNQGGHLNQSVWRIARAIRALLRRRPLAVHGAETVLQ